MSAQAQFKMGCDLMHRTFAFIGTGSMGGALARAAARCVAPADIYLANRTYAKAEALARKLGCQAVSVEEAASRGQFLFLGVKPQMMEDLLAELKPILAGRTDRFILVSMAAGLTMERIREMAGAAYPIIRIMPNTPVSVGEGVIQYDSRDVTGEELDCFCRALEWGGLLDPLPERLIDAGSAVAGCGPAFADLFMEALADGGVACGLPREKAQHYAAQMLLGSAKLLLESGQHPGELKDAVCSPGGSTIAGVKALEARAFRAACMEAVEAAFEKSRELGK